MTVILFLSGEVTGEAITALTRADRECRFTTIHRRSEIDDVLRLIRVRRPDLIVVGVGLDDLRWLPQDVKIILLKTGEREGLDAEGHFVMRTDQVGDEYVWKFALHALKLVQLQPAL